MNSKMLQAKILLIGFLWLSLFPAGAQIRKDDKLRILETIKISNEAGNKIWPGFSALPFSTLMIYDSTEYLVYHPNPSADFNLIGYDSLLQANVYKRPRLFPEAILSCQLVNNYPTLLAGTPEKLRTRTSNWIIKMLHERFHQMQFANSLLQDAAKMNFKTSEANFPYDSPEVNAAYIDYRNGLSAALQNLNAPDFKKNFRRYLKSRNNFKKALTDEEYKFFSFTLWMEGVARYTEFQIMEQLQNYEPTPEISKLKDFSSFASLLETETKKEASYLNELTLKDGHRTCYYTIGYAEGQILDKAAKGWKKRYFVDKFYLEKYFK